MSTVERDERRRYFRIADQVGVIYRLSTELSKAAESQPDATLAACNASIERLLSELAPHEPQWAELIQCLNAKIDRVSQLAEESAPNGPREHELYPVNISACGLGLRLERALPKAALVDLDLLLFPERRRYQIAAEVVACAPEGDSWYVRFDFVELDSVVQEELIQHIVRRQCELLRQTRAASEEG
ncbi:PilZ domain-containing protein [Marinimicrobium sp. ABcell2]|uniref:PilZ domain-containing protein n=1 Tax=Marinimicrobium sp. ABcell2 TaxID=3069751 RepID=UPI0027ADEB80|nr:PilZ domain-containing protein [Marinimicrobium sp. ABcell2]MDQ2076339.1 PilZ domain-containing protein [Marinimicrobium sp. ABcell2]